MKFHQILCIIAASVAAAASDVPFREHVIATDLKGGYQVLPLDMNLDGKTDLIALASGMSELVWFENPGWERHVISANRSRMINLAACTTDADGFPEIILAEGFSSNAVKSSGEVLFLRRKSQVTEPWQATQIDRLPTAHRIRCADIDGSGKPVAVNAPLTGSTVSPPNYRGHVPLVIYQPGKWEREVIGEENEGVMHGIYIHDWDGDGRDEILTASFVGIHVYDLGGDGHWSRTEITRGDPSPWPKSGASDLTIGSVAGHRFIASIEPWHGDQIAVYTRDAGRWERNVIEDSLVDGHTVAAADLNTDGRDEIIAGFRGKGQRVYVFYPQDDTGQRWRRTVLDDGGMSAASCAAVDLNGDERLDVACIGTATSNLKWYENLGAE